MKIFNFLKSKPKKVETKATELIWPIPSGSFLEYAMGYTGRISASMAMQFYQKNSTIATAVDKIANRAEQIFPVLKRIGDNKIINDHPVLTMLEQPNGFDTWQEFMGKLSRHYLLTHDSQFVMLGNTERPPLEVYAIKPQNVNITQALDNFPASYQISIGPGVGHYLRVEQNRKVRFISTQLKEIYHIMGFSSRGDEIHGDSPLEAAALEARQQIKGRLHNVSLLDNGGRLSLVVAFKDTDGIDDDEHKQRKKRIYEDLGGAGNAGKIAVISGSEVSLNEIGVNNKDMDFANLETMANQAIYLRYEIPLPLVSTDASTYNNYQTAILDLYESVVLPHVETLFAGLTKAILPRYGIGDEYYLTYDPESIPALMRQAIIELTQRRNLNIETINELRMLLPNRESLDGGNEIYQAANLVPIGEDTFTGDQLDAEQLARELARSAGIDDQ